MSALNGCAICSNFKTIALLFPPHSLIFSCLFLRIFFARIFKRFFTWLYPWLHDWSHVKQKYEVAAIGFSISSRVILCTRPMFLWVSGCILGRQFCRLLGQGRERWKQCSWRGIPRWKISFLLSYINQWQNFHSIFWCGTMCIIQCT